MANTKAKKEIVEVVEATTEERSKEKVTVTGCDKLRVRLEPTTTAKVVGLVMNGDTLEVIKRIDGWVAVEFEGSKRYVMSQFVE